MATGWSDRDRLAALPLLAGATSDQVDRVAGAMRAATATAGQTLGQEGEAGDDFWLVLSGRLAVTVAGRHGPVTVAEPEAGAVVGELALLRHRPRTATVTALDTTRYLTGEANAMARLLEIHPVRDRLRRLASRRLAEDLRPVLVARPDRPAVVLRPLLPSDRAALDSALHALSAESRRRRFFAVREPSPALVDYLIDIDYVDHFAWVALDAETRNGVATGRYIRTDEPGEAEMAFATADAYQRQGVGTVMLGALGVAAMEAGVDRLVAYVMEDNPAMRRVFAKAGGHSRYAEPGVLHVTVEPGRAAALLDRATAAALGSAVHDVVTAASIALT
ncbi:MAG: GNAT family N-acetyltransferase [Actinomycetota bacterium]|nr:GNAT family N-acetyltransferase [Actinomycetota bacterium]